MTSNAVCDYADADWEINSRGQNACTVYAQLQGLCDPSFVINSVNENSTAYMPPNNACGCNVVAYNLMAGCGWCQSTIQIPWWLTVDQWSGNCTAVAYNTLSIPPSLNVASLTIPEWARALPTGTTWSPSQASRIAVAALSSTSLLASSSGSRSSSTRSPTQTLSGFNNGNFQAARTGLSGALVAIIVIFVLYILAGLAVVAIYFFRQKKRIAWYRPMAEFYRQQKGGGFGFNPAAPLIQNPNSNGYFPPQNMGGQYGQQPQPWIVPTGAPSTASTPYSSTPANNNVPSNGYMPPPPEHHSNAFSAAYGTTTGSSGHGHANGTGTNPFTTPGASSSTTNVVNVAVGGTAHTVAQYPSQTPPNGYVPPAAPSTVGSSTGGANTTSIYSTSTSPYGGMVTSIYGSSPNAHPHAGAGTGPGTYGAPAGSSQTQYANGSAGYSGRPEAY